MSTHRFRDCAEYIDTSAPVANRKNNKHASAPIAKRPTVNLGKNNKHESFTKQRDHLETGKHSRRYRYNRRVPHRFGGDISVVKGNANCYGSCNQIYKLNDPERRSLREFTKAMFTGNDARLAIDPGEILTFQSLYQEVDGSCTFASLLTALHLSELDHLIPKPGWDGAHVFVDAKGDPTNKMYFEAVWWPKFGISAPRDQGETMDRLASSGVFSEEQSNEILRRSRYIPVRSNGMNESMYNTSFWDAEETKARFGLSEEEYAREAPIAEVGNLIEKLIDAGHPIMFGMNGHNTVIVGYNDTRVLCAGSWSDELIRSYENNENSMRQFVKGQGFDNLHVMTQMDVYFAGFHHQDKYMVWNSIRDILYFA